MLNADDMTDWERSILEEEEEEEEKIALNDTTSLDDLRRFASSGGVVGVVLQIRAVRPHSGFKLLRTWCSSVSSRISLTALITQITRKSLENQYSNAHSIVTNT